MAKWADIEGSDAFAALDAEKQHAVKSRYFDSVIAPQAPKEKIAELRSKFVGNIPEGFRRPMPAGGWDGPVMVPPSTDRSWSETASDVREGIRSGFGNIVGGVGTLYGLATGDMDNSARNVGEHTSEVAERNKSPGIYASESARRQKIASEDGTAGKAWEAIKGTVTDPALALQMGAENVSMFLPAAAAGRTAGVVGNLLGLAPKVVGKVATGAAITTSALQQGADVAGDTYDASVAYGAGEDDALSAARRAFVPAATVSVGSQYLPGGSTIERVLAGSAGRTVAPGMVGTLLAGAKGTIGEGLQEGIEEGGGALSNNLARQSTGQKVDTLHNVGESTGLGIVGGMMFGGPAGLVEGLEPIRSGEDLLNGGTVGDQTKSATGNSPAGAAPSSSPPAIAGQAPQLSPAPAPQTPVNADDVIGADPAELIASDRPPPNPDAIDFGALDAAIAQADQTIPPSTGSAIADAMSAPVAGKSPAQAEPVPAPAPVPVPVPARPLDPDQFDAGEFDGKTNSLADKLGLDDAGRAELSGLRQPKPRDPVTGFYRSEERVPFVKRVIEHVDNTDEPSHYIEADIRNLGGLNSKLGATGANEVYTALSGFMRDALEGTGAQVVPVRNGGDEVSFTVVGAESAAIDEALAKADAQAQAFIEERGLSDLPHPKGSAPGAGFVHAYRRIESGAKLDSLFGSVDRDIETRKKEIASGYGTRGPIGTGQENAGTAGGVVSQPADASGIRRGEASGNRASGSAPQNESPAAGAQQQEVGPRLQPEKFGLPVPLKPRNKKSSPIDFDENYDDLLDFVALNGGMHREVLEREGVDPAEWSAGNAKRNQRFVGKPVFKKGRGMTVSDLRERMQEAGFLDQDDPNAPPVVGDDDALQLLMRAVNGERVLTGQGRHVANQIENIEKEQSDRARDLETAGELRMSPEGMAEADSASQALQLLRDAGADINPDDQAEALSIAELVARAYDAGATELEILDATFDESPAKNANALWALINSKEHVNGTDKRAVGLSDQGSTQAVQRGQRPPVAPAEQVAAKKQPAEPAEKRQAPALTLTPPAAPPAAEKSAPVSQGGLFAPPTRGEVIDAAKREKDAQRNGQNSTGRTDILAGDGELFAGPRPEQTDIEAAAAQAATSPKNDRPEPTEAQKEAGNYKKGPLRIGGLDIRIENPAGTKRRPEWPALKHHYGYLKGTVGKDKDHVDIFLSDNAEDTTLPVFVVDQTKRNGHFDEHKVMLGFADEAAARAGYLANYAKGWDGLKAITRFSFDEFKAWVRDETATNQPAATSVSEGDTKNRAPESEDDKSWREWEENYARVQGAESLDTVSTRDIERAMNYAERILQSNLRSRRDGEPFDQFVIDGMQGEIDWLRSAWDKRADRFERGAAPKPAAILATISQEDLAAKAASPDAAAELPNATDKIEDLGEKIGGARKDTSRPIGARVSTSEKVDDRPTWAKRYEVSQIIKSSRPNEDGKWTITDTRSKDWTGQPKKATRTLFDSSREAEAAIPLIALARNHRVTMRGAGNFAIAREVTDRKRVILKDGFATDGDAKRYMAENAVELLEMVTSVGEEALPRPETVMRTGAPRRDGDVAGAQFMESFGFRGVEFGNWNNQAERQEVMNHAYDALMDLAELLDIPPRAISLGGDLALAFGARGNGGKGSARAHYERDHAVMNLTKMMGAGALAHEWFHALDHYLGRQDGKASSEREINTDGGKTFKSKGRAEDYLSHGSSRNSEMREELRSAYNALIGTMMSRAEVYVQDTEKVGQFLGKARDDLGRELSTLREQLATPPSWAKRKTPASAEQLAVIDDLTRQIMEGEHLETKFQWTGKNKKSAAGRWTNDALEKISAILKSVTGRSGFNAQQRGELDRLRLTMNYYGQRLAALVEAQEGAEKQRKIPTEFKREAIKADQGRGTDYWSSPHEMAARAFSAYVEDALSAQGRASDFLSFGSGERVALPIPEFPRPFPGGAERLAINAAFDDLFNVVDTQVTEDERTVLFSVESDPPAKGMTVDEVEQAIADLRVSFAAGLGRNGITINVIPDTGRYRPGTDLRLFKGAYHPRSGRIVVAAASLRDAADARVTLAHELVGHLGLNLFEPEVKARFLNRIDQTRNRVNFKKLWKQVDKHYTNLDRMGRAEEVFARIAETTQDSGIQAWLDGFIESHVLPLLRRLKVVGPAPGMSELRGWARRIAQGIREGKAQRTFPVTDEAQFSIDVAGEVPMDGRESQAPEPVPASTAPPAPPDRPTARVSAHGSDRPPSHWRRMIEALKELVSPETLDRLIYEVQDKYIDLKRIQEHIAKIGGAVNDLNDAYLGEELYHKRVAHRVETFLRDEVKPLMADLKARGVTIQNFERFLHARHAPEANAELLKRNPTQDEIDDGKAKADADVRALREQLDRARRSGAAVRAIEDALAIAENELATWRGAQAFRGTEDERRALSGLSDDDAVAFMDSLSPGERQHLDALAERVDAINNKTLDTLVRYGLMDRESIESWRKTYQYYVPLHRDEAHPDSTGHPVGQGFSVKGDAAKSRTGSTAAVTNILGHIAMQREAALTRGEKNHVVKKLYLLAAQNPMQDLWHVDRVPSIKTIDERTGFVRTGPDPTYRNKPNVVMVRLQGRDNAIVFNERNLRAVRLAGALKNLDSDSLSWIANAARPITRWFASVNTQYNPVFGLVNGLRDIQGAVLNLGTTALKGRELAVVANAPAALAAIYRERRGYRNRGEIDARWRRLWEEMQSVGGTTGYRDLFRDAKARAKALESELAALDRGQVSKAVHAILDWLSDYNEAIENGVRLSAYDQAVRFGMSKERAASLAKNLTVNFNRKGAKTAEVGSLYAFFNASVQGSARMGQTLLGPTGKRILMGGVALGAINTLLAMAVMGGFSDDDDNEWAKIPDFVKERGIIIPLGRQDYLTIPMPLGFHALPNIGRTAVEMMFGKEDGKSAGRQFGGLLLTMAEAFNPLGASGDPLLMASPTALDPIASLARNRDWTGAPIYREDFNGLDPTPGHDRRKESASAPSIALSWFFNSATGGTDYRPGTISWTPDQIDYVIGQLTGGLGREVLKASQTITAPIVGDELPPHRWSVISRFYGSTRGIAGQSEAFYENVKAVNMVENELRGRAANGSDVDGYLAAEPLADLAGMGGKVQRQVSKLRRYRRDVARRAEAGFRDELADIDAQIEEVMTQFNGLVDEARRRRGAGRSALRSR